jgi:hypothetical protein
MLVNCDGEFNAPKEPLPLGLEARAILALLALPHRLSRVVLRVDELSLERKGLVV